jgi:hypothetical protein
MFYLSFANAESKNIKLKIEKCPAPEICNELFNLSERCEKGTRKECIKFVENYQKAILRYDCQKDGFNVPAIHLCSGWDRYLEILSKLKFKKAKMLYGSEDLRKTLDGATAEDHLEKSKKIGKKFK